MKTSPGRTGEQQREGAMILEKERFDHNQSFDVGERNDD